MASAMTPASAPEEKQTLPTCFPPSIFGFDAAYLAHERYRWLSIFLGVPEVDPHQVLRPIYLKKEKTEWAIDGFKK